MNFYRKPFQEDNRFRYFRVDVGDKYCHSSNTEEGCLELQKELSSIGVDSKVECNNGIWNIAIIDSPEEEIFVRVMKLINLDDDVNNEIFTWRNNI